MIKSPPRVGPHATLVLIWSRRVHVVHIAVDQSGSFLLAPESSEDQEPARREHKNDPDVDYQPLQEVVPEEQDVHADHDGYQREHVQHDACLSCHDLVLHDRRGKGDGQRSLMAVALGAEVSSAKVAGVAE